MAGMPTADLPDLLTRTADLGAKLKIAAAVDLLDRCGFRSFEVGGQGGTFHAVAAAHQHGARLLVERQPSKPDALDALARSVIDGGWCKCGRVAHAEPRAERMAQDDGTCRWRRYAAMWVSACDAPVPADGWEPVDPCAAPPDGLAEWTTNRLADALRAAGAPLVLVALAAGGYFDTYRSPHEHPELALLRYVTVAEVDGFGERVIAGEFTADPAERLPGQEPLAVFSVPRRA